MFSLLIFVVFKIVGLLGMLLPVKARDRLVIPCKKIYINALARFGRAEAHTINRVSLIELAFKNMNAKRARALVTIGGMAVGISAIVFLVSIGYGLQELVISRVVKLEEMKQADVSRQMGSKLEIND